MSVKLTEMQKSALYEAANIGSGHAAIALSQLMGKKIMIGIPLVELVTLSQLNEILNIKNKKVTQINLMVLGDAKGIMIFFLEEGKARFLCDIVMGQPKDATKKLGDLEQSALKEVGSIISASYLNALSEMTGLSLVVSVPEYNIGDMGHLKKSLEKMDINIEDISQLLCLKTEFIEATTRLEGYLVLIPQKHSVEKIIDSLKL